MAVVTRQPGASQRSYLQGSRSRCISSATGCGGGLTLEEREPNRSRREKDSKRHEACGLRWSRRACRPGVEFGLVSDLIIVLDTSLVLDGQLEKVEATIDELVAFVEANEPDVLVYQVYLDRTAGQMTVLQMHPDSSSMEFHMQVAAPIFQRFAGRLRLSRTDVYGRPSDALMARLESKAQLLGGAPVVVNVQRGGFVHLGPPAPIASPA